MMRFTIYDLRFTSVRGFNRAMSRRRVGVLAFIACALSLGFLLLPAGIGFGRLMAADRIERNLDRGFAETVHPFLETYCISCHGEEKQKGKLDLRPYSTRAAVAKDYRRWEVVLERLKAGEMPPEEAKRHPNAEL